MPTNVTLDGDRAVVVTRLFAAPRALIWRAFTDADLLQRWLLGPPEWDMHMCEVDVSVGGTYRWRWRNATLGAEFGFTGTYTDVVEGVRLADDQVITQGAEARPMGEATQNFVTFADAKGGTRVTSRIVYPSAGAAKAVMSNGMAEGMEMSYQSLERLLPELLELAF